MKRFSAFAVLPLAAAVLFLMMPTPAHAQESGAIEGRVTLPDGTPAHRADVTVLELGRLTQTDDEGHYRFDDVPAGTYNLLATQSFLSSDGNLVEVAGSETATEDISMRISTVREQVTVTATGTQETTFQAVPSVTSLDAFDLAERMASSLGEALDGELGVAKRSFGSGNARPVVRGFDGDRVLVMQDSMPVGALGSQSGDHAEPVDVTSVERVEVLKGPATLLYGSNAIGGVVNAISSHESFNDQPQEGFTGQVSSSTGTANGQAGGNFSMEYGTGNWLFWLGGGAQRTSDYDTPLGPVENSKNRTTNGSAGIGWYGSRGFLSFGYRGNEGRYGVPFTPFIEGGGLTPPAEEPPAEPPAEEEDPLGVDLALREHTFRMTGGVRPMGSAIDEFRLSVNYSDYNHDELERFEDTIDLGTTFENQQLVYRGVVTQAGRGALSGSFGFSGFHRSYSSLGEEALSPPVDENNFAVFALEDVNLERVRLQFGGRVDHNRYSPEAGSGLGARSLTGASGGVGARFDLWEGGAFVANYTDSFRSPAIEELYNNGPHVGNLTFEVGDPNLRRERSHGVDLSLRQQSSRLRGEANFFLYNIDDFVYLAPTGAVEDNLREAQYSQDDVRYVGAELKLDVRLHPLLWLNLAFDTVDTELQSTSQPLPRIPPARGTFGLDFSRGGLSIRPELVVASPRRDDIFETDTPTAGYAVGSLKASYTIPRTHYSHHISGEIFNIGDVLYRNHVSFIKDLAPEIGRGVRFSYAVKFF